MKEGAGTPIEEGVEPDECLELGPDVDVSASLRTNFMREDMSKQVEVGGSTDQGIGPGCTESKSRKGIEQGTGGAYEKVERSKESGIMPGQGQLSKMQGTGGVSKTGRGGDFRWLEGADEKLQTNLLLT